MALNSLSETLEQLITLDSVKQNFSSHLLTSSFICLHIVMSKQLTREITHTLGPSYVHEAFVCHFIYNRIDDQRHIQASEYIILDMRDAFLTELVRHGLLSYAVKKRITLIDIQKKDEILLDDLCLTGFCEPSICDSAHTSSCYYRSREYNLCA